MQNQILTKAIQHWKYVSPAIDAPSNKKEYEALVARLDNLLDYMGDDENHPLMSLVEMMGDIIERYELQQVQKKIKNKGINALKFLMQAHGLTQKDFPEIATQGVMSEILKGKRQLNLRQIKLLAKRFKVSMETFVEEE